MRPAPLLILALVIVSSIFVSISDSAVARGIRHAGLGAVLAVVPEESKIAGELRSLINRTRLSATEEDKSSEDAARLAAINENQPEALQSLATQLGREVSWVTARRLEEASSPGAVPRNLVVDRGQVQGVGVQALAFSPDGLAGIVALAEDQQSIVLLLTDQQCQIAAQVPGAGDTGMLCGLAPESSAEESEPLLLLKYLSRYANPEPGTEVRSSGVGGLYPANLLLGSVVSYKAGDLHGEALVRPAVKFAELETILLTRSSLP